MICSACRHENPDASAFCEECGARQERRCPSCGGAAAATAKFCRTCGTALEAAALEVRKHDADGAAARKVLSIVFADLIGSTALHERLDPESARRFTERYYAAMRAAVEGLGGTVTQLLGDGVKAVFGAPRVAEDDALRAVRAAVAMQRAFRTLADEERAAIGETGLRIAVNTGELVVTDGGDTIGDPVNVAARLQEQARDGDVVVGEATYRLVADVVTLVPLGTFALKGRTERVAAYRVDSLERPAGVAASAFVGRDDELRRLTAVYDAAVAAPAGRLAVILGSPGLGKSRLIHELGRRLGDRATVLTARVGAAGGMTFAPVAEALRVFLGLDDAAGDDAARAALGTVLGGEDADRTRILDGVAALLAATPVSPEETFFAVRRLLAALAATQPVVLVLDDLHWAEPLLLDLTEHLAQWSTGVPLLIVAAARPELRDARSALAVAGGLVADVVTLSGLDAGAATRLAANVIGADELPAAVAGRVLATSEGNPLFVSELVRMLVHDGALKREGDRWTVGTELAQLEMPPTIHALLAARIERLPPDERIVLERASVVGRQFSRAAVAHLLPREVANLPAKLESLRRSELIEPDTGWVLGEPALRFHHVLIRDAAYRRLLKGTRAELHGRFAEWLEARVGDAVEHEEMLGWHLEQAHRHLSELGPLDDVGRVLGERAARYLGSAGRRALARDDVPLAASLLGRALARLDASDQARADLALDWCEALLAAGDVGPAAAAIDELGRFTATSERLRAWHTCFAGQRAALTDPESLHATASSVAPAAEMLATAGDAAGEAKAHFVHAIALARLGQVGACEGALDRALAAARRANDRRRSNAVLAVAPLAALWGPSPVTRASGRCLDVVRVLRITQGAPAVEAVALRCQGVLEALRGRSEAARRMIASSRRMVEELGITQRLLEADVFAGLVELLEGDAAEAERSLRAAYEGLRAQGLGIDAAQAAALLGRALLALERSDEAETMSHESEALAGDDLQAAIAWRGVRAEALARRGEHASAVQFARAAVDLAAATDSLLYHADARLALAAALRAGNRAEQAAAEETRAIELWEAKGATLLAERARRDGRRLPAVTHPTADRPELSRRVRRRVRPNAASANMDRLVAALAARDADACADLFADGYENVHHPTGTTYGREGSLASMQIVLANTSVTLASETLATLGDSLALFRVSLAANASVARRGHDVGPYEVDLVVLIEVDADGRRRRAEEFANDRLGDAVVRLCERYAELLPESVERARVAEATHAFAALLGSIDLERIAMSLDPDVEFVDHRLVGLPTSRGSAAYLRSLAALSDVADRIAGRVDDVLGLRSDASLVRVLDSGTERTGGGTWERPLLVVTACGRNGLITHLEFFDPDRQEDDALARFDELTGRPDAAPRRELPRARRVVANAATTNGARIDAALAARDAEALTTLLADPSDVVDHTTGTSYGRDGVLWGWRALLRMNDSMYRHDPVATLGDALALCRCSASASGSPSQRFDVGPVERENLQLAEVDGDGRRRRTEIFAADHLADAVARLYERYAERLPEGPARTRAAATARAVAALTGSLDCDRWATAIAPDVVAVDHRPLGLPLLAGAEAFLGALRSLLDLVDDPLVSIDDVLALRPDGLLVRWTNVGTQRAGGGVYERHLLALRIFGSDGLLTRYEMFAPEDHERALARFDELTAEPAVRRVQRRVRPNAATANAARHDAAMTARDVDAIVDAFADDYQGLEHAIGVTYDRRGVVFSMRSLLKARTPTFAHELLATLGDELALCRRTMSASGFVGSSFDVGAYSREEIAVIEVDAQGRRRWSEAFLPDRLGDAVGRLYERYAELLPAGPARDRAAATAHTLARWIGTPEAGRLTLDVDPSIECVDHRLLGTWSAQGANAFQQHWRAQFDVANTVEVRDDDVLALEPSALLIRRAWLGTDRVGGGSFENVLLTLLVFGVDGLMTRVELFDTDREAEALARFDALTAEGPARRTPTAERAVRRPVRANAATAHAARMDAAIAARDADALASLQGHDVKVIHHSTGLEYGREGVLASYDLLLSARNPTHRFEPLATLGDALALACESGSWSEGGDGATLPDFGSFGAVELHYLSLFDVDAQGRSRRVELFPTDRLGDAVSRLYERYAELLPESPARERAVATAPTVAALQGPADPARANAFAPDVEAVDHRIVGFGTLRGGDAALQAVNALRQLSDDFEDRFTDVLALRSDALLLHTTTSGTIRASGGAFAQDCCQLFVFGAHGLLTRWEQFDSAQEAEALARFDALTAEPPAPARRVRPNAATANAAREDAVVAARDADAFPTLLTDDVRIVQHPTGVTYGREGQLQTLQLASAQHGFVYRHDPIATLGDFLALFRFSFSAAHVEMDGFDAGASEIDSIVLAHVDAHGRRRLVENFAADQLGDALVRLYERYAEHFPDGPARTRAAATARSVAPVVVPTRTDYDGYAAAVAPDVEFVDHRTVGVGSGRGKKAYLAWGSSLVRLAENLTFRVDDVLDLRHDALLVRRTNSGTLRDGGGVYERDLIMLWTFGSDGLLTRTEQFDTECGTEALARFDALTATSATPRIENAATRAFERAFDALVSRDWQGFAALFAPGFRGIDRRQMLQGELDRDAWLASYRPIVEMTSSGSTRGVLATRGERLALTRYRWEGTGDLVGPSEIEYLLLIEVDGRGDHVLVVMFDPGDLDAAYAELEARYAAGAARPEMHAALRIENAATRFSDRFMDAWNARDWERIAACFAPGCRTLDRRKLVRLELDRDTQLASLRLAFEASTRFTRRLVATRGDRLALYRLHSAFTYEGSGPSELDWVDMYEVDEHGDAVTVVGFDPDDVDAAYAELGRRYFAGEAAPFVHYGVLIHPFWRPIADADRMNWSWDTLAPDFVVHDHSPLGWGTLDRSSYIESLKTLVALAPDSRTRTDHLWVSAGGVLGIHMVLGTRDGGPYEQPRIAVNEVDPQGRERRRDIYGYEQLEEARARFAALTAPSAAPRSIENAATRSKDRFLAAWEARDWERVVVIYAPEFRASDRRPLVRVELDRAQQLEGLRLQFDFGSSGYKVDVLATRGERLMLACVHVDVSSRAVGPSEIDFLEVIEVNEREQRVLQIVLDPEQLDTAYAELEARYAAGEATAHPKIAKATGKLVRAIRTRDEKRLAAVFSERFVLEDHRLIGWGTLSRDQYLASLRSLFDLRPDVSPRVEHAELADRAAFSVNSWVGGEADGAFEMPSLGVFTVGSDGCIDHWDVYDLEQLEEARARFASLGETRAAPDPLHIPPNAVAGFTRRYMELRAVRDWTMLRALTGDGFVYEDRRKRALLTGDADLWLESIKFYADLEQRNEPIGTAGERIGLARGTFAGTTDGVAVEVEFVALAELDANGGLATVILFDSDDRAAAFTEMSTRFAAGEAAESGAQAILADFGRAFATRDWDAWRAMLAPDAEIRDERALGVFSVGRDQWLQSSDEWVETYRTMVALAPDVRVESLRILAWNGHGQVAVSRIVGTMQDAGPFEVLFIAVLVTAGNLLRHLESFDIDDTDRALARFEELCIGRQSSVA